MKLWDKGINVEKEILTFTVDNDYTMDQNLVPFDCIASIAHAKMLAKMKVLTKEEYNKIIAALSEIIQLHKEGKFTISIEDEDCHTAIENYLTKKLGDAGKKIHTYRSRNDQAQACIRLYCKHMIAKTRQSVESFITALRIFNKKFAPIEMPGYTHMRKAMPSSAGMWSEAFIESMEDNIALLAAANTLLDQSPLGTGAGYGLPVPLDRALTAKEMGFRRIQHNPIYVQNSRGKFESTILHMLSQIMVDLNKISSDIILFSMTEFGFFELSPKLCTGSSIMPQKQNPDVLEFVRAKYHQLNSLEVQVKNTTANLISGYHRDLQLTKEATMKGFSITLDSLSVMTLVIKNLGVNKQECSRAMTPELFATKRAYDLVQKGMPFRDAYKKVAQELLGKK